MKEARVFWNFMAWLLSPEYRQAGRDIEHEFARFDDLCRQTDELNKRARATFTDEEWEAARKRCEARLAELDLKELDTIYNALVKRSGKFAALFSRAELEAHIIFGVLQQRKGDHVKDVAGSAVWIVLERDGESVSIHAAFADKGTATEYIGRHPVWRQTDLEVREFKVLREIP
jgi:hypothetical protein